jgi:hypothetical protein
MSEELGKYISSENDVITANNIKFSISKDNCARAHEIVRELQRLNVISKIDAEMILVCCECCELV